MDSRFRGNDEQGEVIRGGDISRLAEDDTGRPQASSSFDKLRMSGGEMGSITNYE